MSQRELPRVQGALAWLSLSRRVTWQQWPLLVRLRPLTLKFDKVTQPFLKVNMRHGAYQHEKKYNRQDADLSSNLKRGSKIDMEISEIMTGDITIS